MSSLTHDTEDVGVSAHKTMKTMNYRVEEILPKVFLITFDNKYDLCMTFVRIQEFYESPEFTGKYFTLEDFIDYWSNGLGNGSFTYTSVWNGFNIPGDVIHNWIEVFKERESLRDRENQIVSSLQSELAKKNYNLKDIYVIAAHTNQTKNSLDEVVNHESAHALYRIYPEYKKSCDRLLKKVPEMVVAKAEGKLKLRGYNNIVFNDEMQAYFSTADKKDEKFGVLKGRTAFIKNFMSFRKRVSK